MTVPGGHDIEVGNIITDAMFTELKSELSKLGIQHLDAMERRWVGDLRNRKSISGFMTDKSLGSKRLASMPDRFVAHKKILRSTVHCRSRRDLVDESCCSGSRIRSVPRMGVFSFDQPSSTVSMGTSRFARLPAIFVFHCAVSMSPVDSPMSHPSHLPFWQAEPAVWSTNVSACVLIYIRLAVGFRIWGCSFSGKLRSVAPGYTCGAGKV